MEINALFNTTAAASPSASAPDASTGLRDRTFSDQLAEFLTDTGDNLPGLPDTTFVGDHAETDPVSEMIAVLTGITASMPVPSDAETLSPHSRVAQDAGTQTAPGFQDETALHSTGLHQHGSGITAAIQENRTARSDRLLQYFDRLSQPVTADHPTTVIEAAQTRTAGDAGSRTTSAVIPPLHVITPSHSARTRIAPQAGDLHEPAASAEASRGADEIASPVLKAKDMPPETSAATGPSLQPKSGDRDATLAQAPRNIAAESASPGSDNIKAAGDDHIRMRSFPHPPGNTAAPPTEPATAPVEMSGHVELQSDGPANPLRLPPVDGQPGHPGTSPQTETRGTSPNPLSVIRQVADAVVTTRNEMVEITLSPEELGRVRMILTGHERAPHLAIWAERPETLEQMRRNADLLMQQFGEEGLPDATLSFHDHRQHGDAMNDDQPSGKENRDKPPDTSTAAITGGSLGRETPLATGIHRLDVRM